MSMYKNLLVLAAIVLAGCDKGTTPPPAGDSYLSLTTNSTWTYQSKNNISMVSGTYTLKVTGRDSVVNGKTYKVFSNSGAENEYYVQVGSDYYQYANFKAANQKLENLYLKSNVNVGASWDQNISILVPGTSTTLSGTLTNKIEEKGISYTVGSTTYTNVIRVKSSIGPISIPGIPTAITPVTDINSYYAPKVGRIYARSKVSFTVPGFTPVNSDDELILQSSDIKP
ncbi:MAG TPA: hypothetical protein VLC98_14985 [Phnomibacter sp.]|nr:hypothetical protein [Phnomibacter sp.]